MADQNPGNYLWSRHFCWYCSLKIEDNLMVCFRHHDIKNSSGAMEQNIYFHRFPMSPGELSKYGSLTSHAMEELLNEDERLGRLALTDEFFRLRWSCACALT